MQVISRCLPVSQVLQPLPQNTYTSSSSTFQELIKKKNQNLLKIVKRIDAEKAYLLEWKQLIKHLL